MLNEQLASLQVDCVQGLEEGNFVTFVKRSPWLHRQGVVLLDRQDLAGIVAGTRTEQHLHPKSLGTVDWNPAVK